MRVGIITFLFLIGLIALLFNETSGISEIKKKGVQGTFAVTEVISASSKRGNVKCSAKGILDGHPRWFLFEQRVVPSQAYPVVYDPSTLGADLYQDFYVGTADESVWRLLNQSIGSDYLWGGIALATFMCVFGVWNIAKAAKTRDDEKEGRG